MIALQIKEIKDFMKKLLMATDFDIFSLVEGSISTYNTFFIDGRVLPEFYSNEEKEENPSLCAEFSSWSKLRPICFELIKGKKTPLAFKFVFHLQSEQASSLFSLPADSNIKAFVLTIKYDGSFLSCTTGASYHTFTLDKSADTLWDKAFTQFLEKKEIGFTFSS